MTEMPAVRTDTIDFRGTLNPLTMVEGGVGVGVGGGGGGGGGDDEGGILRRDLETGAVHRRGHGSGIVVAERRESQMDSPQLAGLISISKDDSELLEGAFAAADIDGDGQLQPDEVARLVRLLSTVGRTKNRSQILERVFFLPGEQQEQQSGAQQRRTTNISKGEFLEIASGMLGGSDAKRLRKTFTEIKRIKGIFDLCDTDRSGSLEWQEIKGVMKQLGESSCNDADAMQAMQILDGDGSGAIDWVEFIEGLAEGKFQTIPTRSGGPKWKNFSLDNLAAIPAAFDQVYPVSEEELRRVMADFTFLERQAAELLAAAERCRHAAFKNNYAHTHQLKKSQRRNISRWVYGNIVFGALMGGLTSVITILIDNDIQARGYDTNLDGSDSRGFWWLLVLSTIVVIIELLIVYVSVVYVAIRISAIAGLRLWPLNPERALVAQSIVREALELGKSTGTFMGIQATQRSEAFECFNKVMGFLVYRWKRQLTRFVIRLAVRVIIRQVAMSEIRTEEHEEQGQHSSSHEMQGEHSSSHEEHEEQDPFSNNHGGEHSDEGHTAGIVIDFAVNMLWNAIVVRKALVDCRLAILGPPCLVELTKSIATVAPNMSLPTRINLLRTVGVIVGRRQEWHPNHRLMAVFFKDLCSFDDIENPSPEETRFKSTYDIDTHRPTGLRFKPGGLEVLGTVFGGQAALNGIEHVKETHTGWEYYLKVSQVGDVDVHDVNDLNKALVPYREPYLWRLAKISLTAHSRVDLEDPSWRLTDRGMLIDAMNSGDDEANEAVLLMLLSACIIDGHLSLWRVDLLNEAAGKLGKRLDEPRTRKLAYDFKVGRGVTLDSLAPCFLQEGEEAGTHILTCKETFNIFLGRFCRYLSWFS